MEKYEKLKIGDVLLTRSDSFLGKGIRWMLKKKGDPVKYNHVAGYIGRGNILEALKTVIIRSLLIYKTTTIKILRNENWTDSIRALILLEALKYEDKTYGYAKTFILQPLDQIFRTNFFTSKLSFTDLPYCSELWAKSIYIITGERINDVLPNSCEPDDFDDDSERKETAWKVIYEGKNVKKWLG